MASSSDQFTGQTMFVRMNRPPFTVTGKIQEIVPGKGVILQVWADGKPFPDRVEIASQYITDLRVQDAPNPAPQQAFQQVSVPASAPAPAPVGSTIQQQHQQQRRQQHFPAPFPAYQNNLHSPMISAPTQYPPPAHSYQQSQPQQQQHAIPSPNIRVPYTATPQHVPTPTAAELPKPAFVDPAILSMGKPPVRPSPAPSSAKNVSSAVASPSTAQQPFSAAPIGPASKDSNAATQPPIPKILVNNPQAHGTLSKSGLAESMAGLNVRAELADEPVEPSSVADPAMAEEAEGQTLQKKNRRRSGKTKKNANDRLDVEASPARGTRPDKKGKGWRETPMLENTSSFQPYKALRRTKATQDGWASEDVTDVQEMGEFDFESSLRKFDKRTIFDELKENDQIEESKRLVSHNIASPKPKPGTAGGKNLHYTENVLDTPPTTEKHKKPPPDDFWKSEADDGARNGSEKLSGRELGSRQSSRRGEAKPAAARRSQSRKASAANVGQAPNRTNSGVSAQKPARRRRRAKHADDQGKLPTGAPTSAAFVFPTTNRRVEVLSPLQMLNLENIAQNDLGLTEDMMTENAGRGIAEVALHTLTDPAIKVRLAAADGKSPDIPATFVILAGNNKSGYRSIAAARHLRNKGLSIVLCVVGIERERDLTVDMIKQLRLFRNFGGKVYNKSELFEFVRKASIPVISMDAPRSVLPQAPPMAVTLIIDALLGHVTPFEDLRASEQATVYELIEWSNRNEAFVLAVDVPTGIDHTTGRPTVQDGHSLYIRPRYVVSTGAPKKGLLEAVAAGAVDDDEGTVAGLVSDDAVLDWNLYLIDIGLGAAVWKRAGTKIRRGIDFGHGWALQFKFQSSEADQVEE